MPHHTIGSFHRLSFALCVGGALVSACSALGAQSPTARLSGSVIDKSTGGPVKKATVIYLTDGRVVLTDSGGAFRFDSLPAGIVRFVVRATGYPSQRLIVALAKGEYMERLVELDSTGGGASSSGTNVGAAQPLAPVKVEAKPSLGPRFANFERRKATGSGHYITRDEIERGGFSTLQDVARGVRGVTVECGGGLGCHIRMTRAPMQCLPEYIVDDNVDNVFGPTIPVRDIEALEIYTGPSDVPGEYAGRNAGCGVIVIWTRSGPPKRTKR